MSCRSQREIERRKKKSRFTTVLLGHNQISCAGAIALAKALEVRREKVEKRKRSSKNIEVKEQKYLTRLHLNNNEIGDEGAAAISRLLTVTCLKRGSSLVLIRSTKD